MSRVVAEKGAMLPFAERYGCHTDDRRPELDFSKWGGLGWGPLPLPLPSPSPLPMPMPLSCRLSRNNKQKWHKQAFETLKVKYDLLAVESWRLLLCSLV